MVQLMRFVNMNQVSKIFGLDAAASVGEYFYALCQIMPCFLGKQAIVVCGADQDPFFRLAHAVSKQMAHPPPIMLVTRSVPGLDGVTPKMSTSVPASLPVFLKDSREEVARKIAKVKRVGTGTLDELFDKGADLSRDLLFDLVLMFEPARDVVDLLRKAYTEGVATAGADHDNLIALPEIGVAGVCSRSGKTMLLSRGLRAYVTSMLVRVVAVV
jgi:tryptophanyl-tRNA synthetase